MLVVAVSYTHLILGRKIGMTQVFTTDGLLIPVTVVEATENVVLQKKTVATDGYDAIQDVYKRQCPDN